MSFPPILRMNGEFMIIFRSLFPPLKDVQDKVISMPSLLSSIWPFGPANYKCQWRSGPDVCVCLQVIFLAAFFIHSFLLLPSGLGSSRRECFVYKFVKQFFKKRFWLVSMNEMNEFRYGFDCQQSNPTELHSKVYLWSTARAIDWCKSWYCSSKIQRLTNFPFIFWSMTQSTNDLTKF